MTGHSHFEVYPQRSERPDDAPDWVKGELTGEYGWRFRAANGQISAVGGEGFASRAGANEAIHNLLRAVTEVEPHPPILDVDD